MREAGRCSPIGCGAIVDAPRQPNVLAHFDHLGLETANGLGHLSAPGVSGRPGHVGAIEEILHRGADDLGSDVKRPGRDDCLAGNPPAVRRRTRRAAGMFGERARERRSAAHAAQSLCMSKRRDRSPVVVLDTYRPRLSADFGEGHPIPG